MRTVVYGVTTGEYSGWRVRCLFKSRRDAEAHLAEVDQDSEFWEGESRAIEEFMLYDGTPELVRWFSAYVVLCDDGTTHYLDDPIREHAKFDYDEIWSGARSKRATVTLTRNRGAGNPEWPARYFLKVGSADRSAVAKTVSDVVAQWRAQGYVLQGAKDVTSVRSTTMMQPYG